jgi:hypothetical protein
MTESAGDRVEALVREQFGGASLQPPAFDVPSLRFELGGELDPWYRWAGDRIFDLPGPLSRRKPRVRQAVDRAATVYEQLFGRDDDGFFVAYVWPEERPNVEGLLAVLPDESAVERSSGSNYWDDPDGGSSYLRLVAPCSPLELDYRSLFRMLAHTDLGMEPCVSAEVFVVDETCPAIFKMYDDRGALVYAPSADRLAPLAETHGQWLVREPAAVQ